jgi:hypothetical protein
VEGFRNQIRNHLQIWLHRWQPVPRICVQTLRRAAPGPRQTQYDGENKISVVRQHFDYENDAERLEIIGRAAVDLYQRVGDEALRTPLNSVLVNDQCLRIANLADELDGDEIAKMQLLRIFRRFELPEMPLRRAGNELYFSADEWFWFFCAAGLVNAIEGNRVRAAEKLPYPNPVHQYLSALGKTRHKTLGTALITWLLNRNGITENRPVARNFAAYVLGMLNVSEAQDALAEALETDDGTSVRLYCAASLGKLRSRRYLSLLVRQYHDSDDPELRSTLGQAVCRITGVAHYEM